MKPSSQLIEALFLKGQRDRQIRQMAGALMQTFQIPEGHDLVLHLTQARCRNNREAMTDWVRQQVVASDLADESETLPTLVAMFRHKLQSIYADHDL